MTPLAQLITHHWPEVVSFFLVFGRALGVIIAAPFWGGRTVPVLVRLWIAVVLALATYPMIPLASLAGDISILTLVWALAGEVLLGLVLGWLAQLLFAGVRLAGQQIEFRSGMALVQLVDPQEGGRRGIFSSFLEVSAGLIFFTLNGHHLLIQALLSSFTLFPLAGEKVLTQVMADLIGSAGQIFVIALRLSAPVLLGLMLSDIVLGVISRAVPQMNVFLVSQPMQFGLSLLLLMLSLPAFIWFIVRQLPQLMGAPGGVN